MQILVLRLPAHNAPGLGEVNNFDGAQDGVIRDLRKRLLRAKSTAKSAYRLAASHSRSAENAHFALDEVCNPGLYKQKDMNISNAHCAWALQQVAALLSLQALDLQEECMRALLDIRASFAASQRTVSHLSRELIAAQLKHQSSLGNVLSAPAALEAQEALLSRHQTYARLTCHEPCAICRCHCMSQRPFMVIRYADLISRCPTWAVLWPSQTAGMRDDPMQSARQMQSGQVDAGLRG